MCVCICINLAHNNSLLLLLDFVLNLLFLCVKREIVSVRFFFFVEFDICLSFVSFLSISFSDAFFSYWCVEWKAIDMFHCQSAIQLQFQFQFQFSLISFGFIFQWKGSYSVFWSTLNKHKQIWMKNCRIFMHTEIVVVQRERSMLWPQKRQISIFSPKKYYIFFSPLSTHVDPLAGMVAITQSITM